MLVLSLFLLVLPAPEPGGPVGPDALAVDAEFERIAERPLWPGFDPRAVPLAIFDGSRTVLFRHPGPSPEFLPVDAHPGVFAVAGRHSAVTANSSVTLGGVTTATGLFDGSASTATALAAVMIHETFHVFEQKRHPTWTADEGQLFLYPVEDAGNLASARLELSLLRRAMLARAVRDTRCFTAAALALRRSRRGKLPAATAAYERGLELKEGMAAYLEGIAAGTGDASVGRGPFAAEEVRARAYASGPLIGRVLDRLDPHWKETLEKSDNGSLEDLLSSASRASSECSPSERELAAARDEAGRDVLALEASRRRAREEFLAASGTTLVVEAAGEPLWPQGFDPLNVRRLGPREVLHARFVRLGNGAGTVEVVGGAALTEAAGEHPLFQGIRRLTVTGLPDPLPVDSTGGRIRADAAGLRLALDGAVIQTSGKTVRVLLRPEGPDGRPAKAGVR